MGAVLYVEHTSTVKRSLRRALGLGLGTCAIVVALLAFAWWLGMRSMFYATPPSQAAKHREQLLLGLPAANLDLPNEHQVSASSSPGRKEVQGQFLHGEAVAVTRSYTFRADLDATCNQLVARLTGQGWDIVPPPCSGLPGGNPHTESITVRSQCGSFPVSGSIYLSDGFYNSADGSTAAQTMQLELRAPYPDDPASPAARVDVGTACSHARSPG